MQRLQDFRCEIARLECVLSLHTIRATRLFLDRVQRDPVFPYLNAIMPLFFNFARDNTAAFYFTGLCDAPGSPFARVLVAAVEASYEVTFGYTGVSGPLVRPRATRTFPPGEEHSVLFHVLRLFLGAN